MRKPDSLRAQAVAWALMPMLVVLFAGAVAAYLIAREMANRAYDYSLLDEARTIALRIRPTADGPPEVALSPGVKQVLDFDPLDRVYYGVVADRYGVLAGRGDLPTPAEVSDAEGTYYDGVVEGAPVRLITLPVGDGLRITVAETLIKRQSLTRQILLALLVSEVVLVSVGGALLWFGMGRAILPVRRIVDALSRRGQHDLRPIDAGPAPAELRYLAHAINDLMVRLDQSISVQHRFIADAAHQLRTPLAGLMAQIEGALAEADLGHLRATLERLNTTSSRASRLLNQLLTLARAEPGQQSRIDFELLNFAELARTTCERWVPESLRAGMDLGFAGPDKPIYLRGNAPLLEEMVGNLIDNAIQYSRSGAAIDVTVAVRDRGEVLLEVSNEGPAIPEADRERIFARFYRPPGSPGGGSGLGLAIVRDVAYMHGALVTLESAGGRNLFRVAFFVHDEDSVHVGREIATSE